MRILGFDTATRATTVALWDSTGAAEPIEARDDPAPGERPRHTTRLMPLIVELLDRAAISWEELDRIAVGIGPGTFTGLRIGIATARALSRAREVPLVGVSTLESLAAHALARSVPSDPGRRSPMPWWPSSTPAAARSSPPGGRSVPARNSPHNIDFSSRRRSRRSTSPRSWRELPSSVLAVGDGAVEFRGVLEHSGASVPDGDSSLHRVSAINHCRLAASAAAGRPDEIRPEYLRLPDAEQTRRAAAST